MNDFETVRACIEGAARLGIEPFYDGPAALDRIEAEVERLRASQPLIGSQAELGALRAENERLRGQKDYSRVATAIRKEAERVIAEKTAEVKRLRGDVPCMDCGTESYGVWFAPNRLWNYVMGGPQAKGDPGGLLCPNCFCKRTDTEVERLRAIEAAATKVANAAYPDMRELRNALAEF